MKKVQNIITKQYDEVFSNYLNEIKSNLEINQKIIDENFIASFEKEKDFLKEGFFSVKSFYDNTQSKSPEEITNWFLQKIKDICILDLFVSESRQFKNKIALKNFFNKKSSSNSEMNLKKLEESISRHLVDNYQDLQEDDNFNFIVSLFRQDIDFIEDVINYCSIVNKSFNQQLENIDLEKIKNEAENLKNQIYENVKNISNGLKHKLKITLFMNLIELDAFSIDNDKDKAVLEFYGRVLNNHESKENLKNQFGDKLIEKLKSKILNNKNYIVHLKSIQSKKSMPFFDNKGLQRNKAFDKLFVAKSEENINNQEKTIENQKTTKELSVSDFPPIN